MAALQRMWELLFWLPWLDDMGYYLYSLPLHPVFTSVHFALTALALRKEPGTQHRTFVPRHLVDDPRMRTFVPRHLVAVPRHLVDGPRVRTFVPRRPVTSRRRSSAGSVEFALKYPVASFVTTYIVASSGGILANILTGGPPLQCVANGWDISSALLSW